MRPMYGTNSSRSRSVAFWLACLLVLMGSPSFCGIFQVGDSVPLVFEIFDLDTGSVVSGESPTVGIYRFSDGFWLDWDDDTFKGSGWTTQFQAMAEIETTGRYKEELDTTGHSPDNFAIEYSNTGANQTEGTESLTLKDVLVCPPLGTGSIPVNHDYPNPDDQTVEDIFAAPIPDVMIRVYLKANYDAGLLDTPYIEGLTMTDVNGEWEDFVFLDPADYISLFIKRGLTTQTFEFTVVP